MHRQFPYILGSICLLTFLSFMFSCGDKNEKKVESTYDKETVPTVTTHNDTMYISDSGRIKFKVIAETILMFDKANEPYNLLPDSAYMEQYDTLMNIVTTLRADSVWNYTKKKLWKLRGNVKIINVEGKTFDSEELFWDEKADRIYSDLYVVISEPNEMTIRAYGFESNQSMTQYTFTRATESEFYMSEEEKQPEDEETNEAVEAEK